MKRLYLFTILFVLSCSICSANLFSSEAIHQAEQFSSLIDNGDYQAAYQSSSVLLHISLSEQEWNIERDRTEKLLGRVLERKLVSIKSRDSYPGLPDGNYLIVYYEAKTERKSKAAEVLLLSRYANRWEVCGYKMR